MKTAIRLVMCVAMAAASAAAFAGGEDQTSGTSEPKQGQTSDGYAYAPTKGHEDTEVGSATGEPSRAGAPKQDDKHGQSTDSLEEYNHRRFLEEVWTRP